MSHHMCQYMTLGRHSAEPHMEQVRRWVEAVRLSGSAPVVAGHNGRALHFLS